jgi:hypothetical protein
MQQPVVAACDPSNGNPVNRNCAVSKPVVTPRTAQQ